MLHDVVDDPATATPAELRAAYEAALRDVLDDRDVAAVAATTGVDESTLAALVAGESPDVTVEEAAAVLAVDADATADDLVFELRDHLLMGMTTGVLDVDTLASETDLDLTGQEVQQALEGRTPMTLAELAAFQHAIAARKAR
jgi:hypothetical protein